MKDAYGKMQYNQHFQKSSQTMPHHKDDLVPQLWSRDARRRTRNRGPHLQVIRNRFPGLFRVQTMVQFFWQADLVNVTKFFL
jgi:hypothetical protein